MKPSSPSLRHTPLYTAILCAFALGGSLGFQSPAYAMAHTYPAGSSGNLSINGTAQATITSSGSSLSIDESYGRDSLDAVSGKNTIWLHDINDVNNPTLTIHVTGQQKSVQDFTSDKNITFISGAFISHAFTDTNDFDNRAKLAEMTSKDVNSEYSDSSSGATVKLILDKDARFAAKIHGGRNDIGGGTDLNYDQDFGKTNDNTVDITLNEGSQLYAKLIFGGRSSQVETVKYRQDDTIHPGYETDRNRVIIHGGANGLSYDTELQNSGIQGNNPFAVKDFDSSTPTIVAKGIFGAEGYQANQNLVKIENAVIAAGSANTRKLGIVGGRGLYDYRIGAVATPDSNGIEYVKTGIANNVDTGIANNNTVVIKDSYIGYSLSLPGENAWQTTTNWDYGFSIYGGWSTGEAKNNIVAVENSIVNGNIIGGLEFKNIAASDADHLRELNANLVSLHNVTLVGNSAIYGTATANAQTVKEWNDSHPTDSRFHQDTENRLSDQNESIQSVNRRRGIAYIAGENTIANAYVRYIHFGQYYDTQALENDYKTNHVEVSQNYYPSGVQKDERKDTYEVRPPGNVIYTNDPNSGFYDENEKIQLGQQVAGSFMINTNGFHSSLSRQELNQSAETNGQHNFWVAAYTNLTDQVEGGGTLLDTTTRLFKKDNSGNITTSVNHYYGENGDQQLSLLTHDDGMVFDTKKIDGAHNLHSEALMHQFRYHYDGRVLYLGVNNGKDADNKDTNAVAINFDRIQEFREKSDQKIDAFGNTQIGISIYGQDYIYGKKSVGNGDKSTRLEDMTFDIGGFAINQARANGQSEKVADATYSFYKYMHFDGSDQNITINYLDKDGTPQTIIEDSNTLDIKATTSGQEGGVGIKYWLKELNVLAEKQLVLHGATADDLENGNIGKDNYTLSAQVTGSGGVYIPENDTVIMGDENSIYRNKTYNESWKNWFNTYTGITTVDKGATLQQGADTALGFTQKLELNENSQYQLNGKTQTIGGLRQKNGSTIVFDVPITSGSSPDTPGSGHLTIDGKQSGNGSTAIADIAGTISGDDKAILDTIHTDLTINTANPGYSGEVNLKSSDAWLENGKALENASTNVDTGSRLYLNGAEKDESKKTDNHGNANSHYLRNLTNAGTVYLSGQRDASIWTVNTVQIKGNYVGNNGKLVYNTRLNGDNDSPTDFIAIRGTASGTSTVLVKALPGSHGAKTNEGIHILHADKADKGFTLKENGPITAGAWYYGLEGRHKDETNGGNKDWYLVNTGETRAEAGSYVDNSLAWAEMHMRLHDRMGQAHYRDPFTAEIKDTAAWGRIVGNHTHFRTGNGTSKTHSETEIIQLGSDIFRKRIEDSDWKYNLGAFGGYLNNRSESLSRYSAKSKVDGYALGVYGTLYTGNSPDDGFYLDSWLMWGNYDNEIYGSLPKFSYDSDGWVASLEVGKTLPIGESGEKGIDHTIWTFQPQAQVIWDGMKADRAEDSTHTVYRQLGGDNVILRLGARLHANMENRGLGFVEANWIHHAKKRGVLMNSDSVYQDGSRDSGEIRVGAEGYLEKNTLGWVTLGVRAGSHGYHEESAQIGIKHMF